MQYARNFYERFEVAFNAGIPSSGITSPASMAVVAGAYAIIQNWNGATLFLSIFGFAVSFVGGVLVARKALGVAAAWVFAALFSVSGRFLYHGFSGMDTMLFCAAGAWVLYFVLGDRPIACGAVLGFAWMVRPEAVFLAVPAGLWFWFRHGFKQFAMLALVAVAVAAPWVAFCLSDTGSVFPATLLAKSSLQAGSITGLGDFLAKAFAFWSPSDAFSATMEFHPKALWLPGWDKWLHGAPILLPGLLAMAVASHQSRRLYGLILAVLGLHFLAVFSRGAYWDGNFHRYCILNYFFAMLSAACLVAVLLEHRRHCLRWTGWVVLAAAIALSVRDAVWAAKSYQFWCRHTLALDGQTALWIGKNLPPDAVVGVHNAGCVKWFGQRKTVDFAALTTTRMHERLMRDGFLRLVYDHDVGYFAYHGDEVWAKYGFPHMSKSPYFQRLPAPGRGLYQVRRELLADLFALDDAGKAR